MDCTAEGNRFAVFLDTGVDPMCGVMSDEDAGCEGQGEGNGDQLLWEEQSRADSGDSADGGQF
jgi:hypothetical protein